MTRTLVDPRAAETWAAARRAEGCTLGFVPTMGALHGGHLELVRRSVRENDATCVSIFVNPLQFDRADDFDAYPRDSARDAELLAGAGCDLAFTGELAQFFPESGGDPSRIPQADPGELAEGLEGAHRPGHFAGVATIVRRLFELVRPTRAYFGEKDFQQTLVVGELARAAGAPVVCVVPTVREPSGLAASSRNERLVPAEREQAAAIARGLFAARRRWREGERVAERLLAAFLAELEGGRLELEYAELRDPARWSEGPLSGPVERGRLLVAARMGGVRLIDNLRLDGEPDAGGR